jgi:hypothetical protein
MIILLQCTVTNRKLLSKISGAFVVKVTSQVASDIYRNNSRSAGNRMRVTCFRLNEHLKHLSDDNEHTVGLLADHGTVYLLSVDEFRCFCNSKFLPVPWNPEKWLRSQFSRQLGTVQTFLQLECSAIF